MPYQQYNFKPQTFDAQKKRPDLRLLYISPVSYTHLTLPTNSRV